MVAVYEIMHLDRRVASVDTAGNCKIYFTSFMPYNLYFEEGEDLDTKFNNLANFYFWCASRVLTLDRQHAKALLNSAGLSQAITDKDRAQIALTYRCLSLTDVFWVRQRGERTTYAEVNLYENHLDKAFIDIALRGRQYTVQNEYLARDLSTNGVFPKAWRRTANGFQLLKDGGKDAVDRELLASRICQCFDVDQVVYEADTFDGEPVSSSLNMTSRAYSIAPIEALNIKLTNQEKDPMQYILKLDQKNYYMMNIVDYLIGNPDRHWGNWGVLVDNATNKPMRLHDLMDFNQAFMAYDTLEGANCQTAFARQLNQQQAAIEAIRKIGLHQIASVEEAMFADLPKYYEMFCKRMEVLHNA